MRRGVAGLSPGATEADWCSASEAIEWIALRGGTKATDSAAQTAALREAERLLAATAARGLIRTRGEPGDAKRPTRGAIPQAIPSEAYLKQNAGLTPDNRLGLRPFAPIGAIVGDDAYAGLFFYHVEVCRADLMQAFPPTPAAMTASRAGASLAGALPPFLTLMQAVAWIATRDEAVVRRAGDLTVSDTEGHNALVVGPDGNETFAWVPRRGGADLLRIEFARTERKLTETPSVDASKRDLLAALRDGSLRATGRYRARRGDPIGRRELIARDEWASMELDTEAREDRVLVAHYPQDSFYVQEGAWREVMLAREDIAALWPALGSVPPPDGYRVPAGYMTAREVCEWIAFGSDAPPEGEKVRSNRLKDAGALLIEALANRQLRAFGRRGSHYTGRCQGEPAEIPHTFFLYGHRAIYLDGWAALNGDEPDQDYMAQRHDPVAHWGELAFEGARVRELWPDRFASSSLTPQQCRQLANDYCARFKNQHGIYPSESQVEAGLKDEGLSPSEAKKAARLRAKNLRRDRGETARTLERQKRANPR